MTHTDNAQYRDILWKILYSIVPVGKQYQLSLDVSRSPISEQTLELLREDGFLVTTHQDFCIISWKRAVKGFASDVRDMTDDVREVLKQS